MGSWTFEVETAQPKQRARVTRFGARTPKATVLAENLVAIRAAEVMPTQPVSGPVRVDLVIVRPRPARLRRRKDPDGLLLCDRRPDADNVRKMVLDGLSARLVDDAQVCDGRTVKVYGPKDDARTYTVVRVTMLEPDAGALSWADDLIAEVG